jgi:hypothetical protein
MKMLIILTALISLAACDNSNRLASPQGPSFALNAGHWQPSAADLVLPKPGPAE